MDALAAAVADLVGIVVTILFLAAIVVCALKGRRGAGWFGVITFVVGLSAWFPLYRFLRAEELTAWFWLWRILGMAAGIIVIVAAVRPARLGSWWQRRDEHRTGSRPTTVR